MKLNLTNVQFLTVFVITQDPIDLSFVSEMDIIVSRIAENSF